MDTVPQKGIALNTIEEAIEEIRQGKVVIVVDDEERENEGDFICAAECVTPEIINFMATHGRGLICAPVDEKRADELDLHMMVNENTALHETAFTVSIDLIGKGCTTGISAHDRATCIKALVGDETKPSDFAKPGHIFPLRAKTGGVLRRSGHTEAAIDLARLAGFKSVGVLVEILNPDGSMARLPQLVDIAREHDLRIISIKDLISYRMERERIVEPEISLPLDSHYGPFEVRAYKQITNGDIHLAFIKGEIDPAEPTLVRVHSASETGDILGRLFDEYGAQLKASLELIAKEGKGVLLYMRHSEKGISIVEKLKEYASAQANTESSEQRDFGVGAQILRDIGIRKIRLLTNRPRHRVGLIGFGLEITENVHVLPRD